MESLVLVAVAIAIIAIIWMFRKVIKEWADRAQEVSAVTSYEVKKSSIDRMSKIKVTEETLSTALANKTSLDAIDLL